MTVPSGAAEGRRAVIDIGSNSVRLVVFAGDRRVPAPLLNEKVSARLGKSLQVDGLLPERAMDVALRGLERFKLVIDTLGVQSAHVVATAAVRDALNGPEFLDRVCAIGLDPRLLSGGEEARASASGVACAFPDAEGVVADLGGGSLELLTIGPHAGNGGVTLPLGTLRLARLREKSNDTAQRKVHTLVRRGSPSGMAAGRPLFLVGGSWRALAQFAMHEIDWPVRTPHGFTMPASEIDRLVNVLAHTPQKALQEVPRLPAARVASLSDAALVLAALVRHLRPSVLITSSFGLREGLMFGRLDAATRARDPLTAALGDELGPGARGTIYGELLFGWAAGAFPDENPRFARLRLAASWLGHPLRETARPTRPKRALELTLEEPLIGADAEDRGMIAAALLAFDGERAQPAKLGRLASPDKLEQASRWGCVMRLAEKISAGNDRLLSMTRIEASEGMLTLHLLDQPTIFGEAIETQLKATAEKLGLRARVQARAVSAKPLAGAWPARDVQQNA